VERLAPGVSNERGGAEKSHRIAVNYYRPRGRRRSLFAGNYLKTLGIRMFQRHGEGMQLCGH
jgi:hypothetical protein